LKEKTTSLLLLGSVCKDKGILFLVQALKLMGMLVLEGAFTNSKKRHGSGSLA